MNISLELNMSNKQWNQNWAGLDWDGIDGRYGRMNQCEIKNISLEMVQNLLNTYILLGSSGLKTTIPYVIKGIYYWQREWMKPESKWARFFGFYYGAWAKFDYEMHENR